MSAYAAIVSARFRALLQYRLAAAAGFGTQLFWGFIRVMIFGAFYRSAPADQPMSYPEVVVYVWLGQAMLAVLPWNVDSEIRAMIRSGAVVYEMLRPLDLYALWFSRILAMRTAPTLMRAVPMFIVATLFLGMKPPPSIDSALAWAAAMAGAVLLSCAITALLSISLLWTISGEGIARIAPSVVLVFSGMLVPLPLLPDWAQAVVNVLPFRGVADTPFRLYIGHIPPGEVGQVLAQQIGWTIALVALGRWVLSRGVRRLVAQGG